MAATVCVGGGMKQISAQIVITVIIPNVGLSHIPPGENGCP